MTLREAYLGVVIIRGRWPHLPVVVRCGPLALLGRGGRRGRSTSPPRLASRTRPTRSAVYHLMIHMEWGLQKLVCNAADYRQWVGAYYVRGHTNPDNMRVGTGLPVRECHGYALCDKNPFILIKKKRVGEYFLFLYCCSGSFVVSPFFHPALGRTGLWSNWLGLVGVVKPAFPIRQSPTWTSCNRTFIGAAIPFSESRRHDRLD